MGGPERCTPDVRASNGPSTGSTYLRPSPSNRPDQPEEFPLKPTDLTPDHFARTRAALADAAASLQRMAEALRPAAAEAAAMLESARVQVRRAAR